MRLSLFSSLNNRKHMRVPRKPSLIFSLNNRKRQDLKSCSVALCAITFQLRPCFPWNCAPLEQKNGPAIQNIRFQATAIFANFLVFFLTYVLSHIIFPYLLIKNQHELYNLPPFIEGSLEVKLPTIWRDEKQSREEAERRERLEERRSEEKESEERRCRCAKR